MPLGFLDCFPSGILKSKSSFTITYKILLVLIWLDTSILVGKFNGVIQSNL